MACLTPEGTTVFDYWLAKPTEQLSSWLLRRVCIAAHAVGNTCASGAVCSQQGRTCMRANVEAVWVTSSGSESDGAPLTGVELAEPSCVRQRSAVSHAAPTRCPGCIGCGDRATGPE